MLRARYATPEDYPGVMALGDVYDGLDYLGHLYPKYMKDPQVHCFVVTLEEKVVAFSYILVVDRGKTTILGGGRIKEDLRGTNVFRVLQVKLAEFLQENCKNSDDISTTWDSPTRLQIAKKRGEKILYKRGTTSFSTTSKDVASLLKTRTIRQLLPKFSESVKELSTTEAKEIMLSPKYRHLFPEGRINIFFEPYRLEEENIDYFMKNYCRVFAHMDGDRCRALGCVTPCPCNAGLRLDFEFYGDQFDSFLLLMKEAIQVPLKSGYSGDIHVIPFYPETFDAGRVHRWVFTHCGWGLGPWFRHTDQLTVWHPQRAIQQKSKL